MQTAEIVALIAAIGFFLWAFFKLGRFIVTEWREIEAEEELRRRCPSLRKRGVN